MSWNLRARTLIACVGLAVAFTVLSVRLVHLQVNKHDDYLSLAAKKHESKEILPAVRGTIFDVRGEALAVNDPFEEIVADSALVHPEDVAALTDVLLKPLVTTRELLEKKLRSGDRYIELSKTRVTGAMANELRSAIGAMVKERRIRPQSGRAILYQEKPARRYPNDKMLCHVIGFLDHQRQGVQGVEASMNSALRGYDGFRYVEHDRKGKELGQYRKIGRPPSNGAHVHLTVDTGLQNIVENELMAVMKQYTPKSVTIILTRPKTGEVLAMASSPGFDLNDIAAATTEDMKNPAIMNVFEPGSTFKIVAVGGALNEKRVRPDTVIFCENGIYLYGGKRLKDHHHFADLTVTRIIAQSSNIGSAKLAIQLGPEKFYEYLRRFGFGERTGINLPGETPGIVHPPYQWNKLSITRIPIGQSVGVNCLQMAAAMGAVANGGKLMMPQIVSKVVDDDGREVASFPPLEVRRVISPEAAADLNDALKEVVTKKGTGFNAAIKGFRVAGKTGTAEKPGPNGGYLREVYVLSFLGYFPADDPQVLGYVVVDAPDVRHDQNYGGTIAGPIFARVGERAARYLNLEPDPAELGNPKMLTTTR